MLTQSPMNADFAYIIPFVIIAPVFILFVYFLITSIKKREKTRGFLLILFMLLFTSNLLQIITFTAENIGASTVLYIISQVVDVLSLFMLLSLLEIFQKDRAISGTVLFFGVIAFALIGMMISTPEITVSDVQGHNFIGFSQESLELLVSSIFSLLATIWTIFSYFKNRKALKNRKQRRFVNLMYLGIFLSQSLGNFLPTLGMSQIGAIAQNAPIAALLGLLTNFSFFKTIGVIIVAIAFIRVSKYPWLLQSQKIHFVLVYSGQGIPLYSKIFNKSITDNEMSILTGGFSAISSLFNEAMKSNDPIKSINFNEKELRIIKKDKFLCALMVEYSTPATNLGHQKFADKFELQFEKELENFAGNVSTFKSADKICSEYFC